MTKLAWFIVYATLPYLGAAAGARLVIERGAHQIRLGATTAVLAGAIAISSTIGIFWLSVLHSLERDTDRIQHGEVWRLVTALTQQDSGAAGMLANVFALLIVGSVCEHLLGRRRMVFVFIGAGVLSQLPALLWQTLGAGNSVEILGSPAPSRSLLFWIASDRL